MGKEEWFSLQERSEDHQLYIREAFVDDSRPIRYILWHSTGLDARIYRASFGPSRIGRSLIPTEGPGLTFRFEEMPDAEIIAIDQHASTSIKLEEELPLPVLQEHYRDTILPEWHQGKWMYCISSGAQTYWYPLLPEHLMSIEGG